MNYTEDFPEDEGYIYLSADETDALTTNFLHGRAPEGAEEEEIIGLVDWAISVRMSSDLLDRVLMGDLVIGWNGTEPTFLAPDEPVPGILDMDEAEQMIARAFEAQ